MDKLTNLEHLRRSAAKSKELIGEVAESAAQAINELAQAVGGLPVREVSEAEYEALSEEEKQAEVVYLVTDAPGQLEPPHTDVYSFNGRTQDVVPKSGDYTAEMVGADPAGSALAAKTALEKALAALLPRGCILIWSGRRMKCPRAGRCATAARAPRICGGGLCWGARRATPKEPRGARRSTS